MAIASGKATVEGGVKRLYTGVVPLMILAVNPSKKELEGIYGNELDKEPEYLSIDEKDGTKKIRFDFIVQSCVDPKNGCNDEFISKVSYFLEDKPNLNKDGDKAEVINLYGESTWLTKEAIQTKTLPDNMSFYCKDGMRVALKGEVDLVTFIKQFMGVPARQFQDKIIPNVKDAECQLDDIKKYFSGNIKEIVSAIDSKKKTNKVKLLAGVKSTDDNKQYQAWFTQKPLKYGMYKYEYILKAIKDKQANGSYPNVDFGPDDLKMREFKNEPTEFKNEVNDNPFAAALASGIPVNAAAAIADDWFGKQ